MLVYVQTNRSGPELVVYVIYICVGRRCTFRCYRRDFDCSDASIIKLMRDTRLHVIRVMHSDAVTHSL